MAKTLANLRVGTRVYLDEAAQADFLDSEVDRSINYAQADVAKNVVSINEDFYFTTTPKFVSTLANVQEYAFDATIVKVRRVEINYNPSDVNSVAVRATAIKTEEMPQRLASNSLGSSGLFNPGYYINGQQGSQVIGFTPVPNNAGTNNVSIWGVVMPSDLVNASDSLSLPYPDMFGYLVELRAAAILLRKGQQAENIASKYLQDYKDGILEMKNFLTDRQSDGVQMIADALGEDTIFDHPM